MEVTTLPATDIRITTTTALHAIKIMTELALLEIPFTYNTNIWEDEPREYYIDLNKEDYKEIYLKRPNQHGQLQCTYTPEE